MVKRESRSSALGMTAVAVTSSLATKFEAIGLKRGGQLTCA